MVSSNKPELVIGNWYTQYSAGYWQLIDIKPFYAFDDYTGEKVSWKKGDRIGDFAIVKKAFTPKMKKSVRVEYVNAVYGTNLKSRHEVNRKSQIEINRKSHCSCLSKPLY